MSEPSSFLLKYHITQENLHRYMASRIKAFDAYDDWDMITFELSDEDIGFARDLILLFFSLILCVINTKLTACNK